MNEVVKAHNGVLQAPPGPRASSSAQQPVAQAAMPADAASRETVEAPSPRTLLPWHLGLSGKLLLLTIIFVMVAQVLIYVPAIATFRLNWLNDRLASARTAALVLDAAPSGMVSDDLARKILDSIGAKAVAVKRGNQRRLLAIANAVPPVTRDYDLRGISAFHAIVDAFETLTASDNGVIRLVGEAPMEGMFLEIVLDEPPLRAAMQRFSVTVLLISLIISGITAALVYLSLLYLFVRPMRRITDNMMAFRADPENPARVIAPSSRHDEVGMAERELSAMQGDLASMLQQKTRLAALGLAVSKINHDLRNMLTSAQLFSDQLAHLPDARVQRFAPRLVRALERAIAFCQSTLSYGSTREAAPHRGAVLLERVLTEVRETLAVPADGSAPRGPVRWVVSIPKGMTLDADPEHLFRILLNLSRNALQALETRDPPCATGDEIRITGRRQGPQAIIEVSDNGPGLSEKARANLFKAFQGSTRSGGTGLGLAIAAELTWAHGGDIELVEGGPGATFRITIPDRTDASAN